MRQRTKDGTRFVCMSRQAEPQSDYLRSRRPFFSPAMLDELGSLLAPLPSDASKEDVQAVVARLTKAPGVTLALFAIGHPEDAKCTQRPLLNRSGGK